MITVPDSTVVVTPANGGLSLDGHLIRWTRFRLFRIIKLCDFTINTNLVTAESDRCHSCNERLNQGKKCHIGTWSGSKLEQIIFL